MTNNTFVQNLANASNYTRTANGALAHKSTMNALLDLFALGGAYRQRSDEDAIFLFKKAFDEDETYAMKCLFYLRDARGGQGERRFFRVCMRWLAKNHLDAVVRNLDNFVEYGRYDDWFVLLDTPAKAEVLKRVKTQLVADVQTEYPTLLAKWLPSENTSSADTRKLAGVIRNYLGWSHKQYRKTLSILRERINVLERLMSANEWDKIEFDKIPSKAGLQYRKAFERHDIERKKANPEVKTYEEFAKDTTTKVNAETLYPYDIVAKAVGSSNDWWGYSFPNLSSTDRAMIEKYWVNQKDYLNGVPCKMMCVVDTSGSMTSGGKGAATPINVAISLGMYCAERIGGPFKDHFISFSRSPRFIKVEGIDFVDKVRRIYKQNLCENTNLTATFDLLLETCMRSNREDWPTVITIISDMQIDNCYGYYTRGTGNSRVLTEMEAIRQKWANAGIPMPRLVYWCVNSSSDVCLDLSADVQLVSGCSASLFQQILQSKSKEQLMMDILNSERYAVIK